jgi:transmembrane sensor
MQTEQLNAQARDWFTLMQSGAVTEVQRQQLQQWLSESPAHAQAYREYEAIWNDLGNLAASEEGEALRHSVAPGIFARVFSSLAANTGKLFASMTPTAGAGAAVAATLVVALLVLSLRPQPVERQSFVTATSEVRALTLEDGSLVTLGAKSELNVWFSDVGRHIELIRGQAFFDVSKDPARPFWVQSGDSLVKVVGTQFDVRRGSNRTRVAVAEGIVNVFAAVVQGEDSKPTGDPVVLTAGKSVQKPMYREFDEVSDVAVKDVATWRQGRLVYRKASLAEVVADANRYSEGTIALGTGALKDLEVTAAFKTDQMDVLPEMLAQILPIVAYREEGNRILIMPRSGGSD